MADYTAMTISGAEFHKLADMNGVLQDLFWVREICERILKYTKRGSRRDLTELSALEAAALIRYGRCFKSGVRNAFRIDGGWIDKLPHELQEAHRDFETLRDKHIAHSVNDWELNLPVVNVREESSAGVIEVLTVGVRSSRMLTMTVESIEQLKTLADTLWRLVQTEFEEEKKRMLDFCRRLAPLDLQSRLGTSFARIGTNDLSRSRDR